MSRSYLDSQSFEEVALKLQGKTLVTPQELEKLKIFSATCSMEKYRNGTLGAEQHGKKTFLFYTDDVLEHVAEIMMRREEKKKPVVEEKPSPPSDPNQSEFVLVNKFLIDQLEKLISDLRRST